MFNENGSAIDQLCFVPKNPSNLYKNSSWCYKKRCDHRVYVYWTQERTLYHSYSKPLHVFESVLGINTLKSVVKNITEHAKPTSKIKRSTTKESLWYCSIVLTEITLEVQTAGSVYFLADYLVVQGQRYLTSTCKIREKGITHNHTHDKQLNFF